jgi:hypothetical protein
MRIGEQSRSEDEERGEETNRASSKGGRYSDNRICCSTRLRADISWGKSTGTLIGPGSARRCEEKWQEGNPVGSKTESAGKTRRESG